MSKAREALERAVRQQQGPAQAEALKAMARPLPEAEPVAVVPPPTPPPPPPAKQRVTVTAAGIQLFDPTIELGSHHIMTNGTFASQTNKLTPKEALIAHGVVIVRELNLILPLNWCLIRS